MDLSEVQVKGTADKKRASLKLGRDERNTIHYSLGYWERHDTDLTATLCLSIPGTGKVIFRAFLCHFPNLPGSLSSHTPAHSP